MGFPVITQDMSNKVELWLAVEFFAASMQARFAEDACGNSQLAETVGYRPRRQATYEAMGYCSSPAQEILIAQK
jgi:hypothetical protein